MNSPALIVALRQQMTGTPRSGKYILYRFRTKGFTDNLDQLSGDDWFPHDPEAFPVQSSDLYLRPDLIEEEWALVWMHFSHYRDSGASQLLEKWSPANTDEGVRLSKVFQGFNIGAHLDLKGDYEDRTCQESSS